MSNLSQFFPPGSSKVWVSGTTYAKGNVILSPAANYAPYVRITDGAGTTDPASDSTNYRAYGQRIAKSLVGNDTTSAADLPGFGAAGWRASNDVRQTLSGALTANTYKTILSVTGQGILKFCAVASFDTTPRTQSLRITIDGVVVCEKSVASISSSNKGIVGVGGLGTALLDAALLRFDSCRFNASLLVEVKSNITETDKIYTLTNYEVQ